MAHPQMAGYHAQIARLIEQYGHAVTGVGEQPMFYYTTGLAVADLPELLMIGNLGETGKSVLNAVADDIKVNGTAERDIDLGGRFPVRLRNITDPAYVRSRYTIQTGQHFGREDYPVMQVLIPDTEGRFPGDPAIHPAFDFPVV